jgi:hypothetical protein
MELVALSRALNAYIYVHQLNQLVFCIQYDVDNVNVRQSVAPKYYLHLAYHDEQHYSSVRRLNDNPTLNEKPTFIHSHTTQPSSSSTKPISSMVPNSREKLVMKLTNEMDLAKIRQLLEETQNDVNAVIEIIQAEVEITTEETRAECQSSFKLDIQTEETKSDHSITNETTIKSTKRNEIKNAKQRRQLEKEKKEIARLERHKEKLQRKIAERIDSKVDTQSNNDESEEVQDKLEMLII